MLKVSKIIFNRRFAIILFAAIFVILLILQIFSVGCNGEEKIVNIEKGMGSDETAQRLKDEGIIRSKWFFVFYVWIKGYGSRLQAGEYLLNPQMSIPKIAKIIVNGEVNQNYIKVTIPEGWDIKKIKNKLVESSIINQDENILLENEGYLFPDTYYFFKDFGAEVVIKKMRDNFNQKTKSLVLGAHNIYDILKMASIIEKEVKSDEDRAIVSGIFWKRIENNIPLQSCATIAYILGVEKTQYTYEDTRVESPYNTYTNLGLPPTPINNPGLSTINAALNPEQTDYNFFLSDPATGNTIFSKTLEEHNRNKAKYLTRYFNYTKL